MARPVLLDLFCGAGGAAMGYYRAGFDVVGIDISPQPRYPFEFQQADALVTLRDMALRKGVIGPYRPDAIHASPPCQAYSVTRSLPGGAPEKYPMLIEPVREALQATGLPYVIENVQGARAALHEPVMLCGSSFGIGVRRHRLFEVSFPVEPLACAHHLQPEPVDVTGTGGPSQRRPGQRRGMYVHRKPRNIAHAREVMGIEWMTRKELSQAIPPAYTEYIGFYLLAALPAELAA